MLNGVQFKKGAMAFLLVDLIHYDPNVWADPDVFNPDRYVYMCDSQCTPVYYYSIYTYVAYCMLQYMW